MIKPVDSIFDADSHDTTGRPSRINVFLTVSGIFVLLLAFALEINLKDLQRMGLFDLFIFTVVLGIPIACALLVYKRKKLGWISGFVFYEFVVLVISLSIVKQLMATRRLNLSETANIKTDALLLMGCFLFVLLLLSETRDYFLITQKMLIGTALWATIANVLLVTFLVFAGA